jgi:UDP-GlcNAc:undecaprenyl-phosphate GlcNAc-1-phosphate transferase
MIRAAFQLLLRKAQTGKTGRRAGFHKGKSLPAPGSQYGLKLFFLTANIAHKQRFQNKKNKTGLLNFERHFPPQSQRAPSMNNDLVLVYSGYFICSILLAFLLNALFLRFSRTMGVRANPELVRWSATQKPAVGGISFFVMFLLSIACYAVFFPYRFMPLDKELLGVLGTVTLAFVMGLADDAYNTQPFIKLAVQILCGIILIMTNQSIHIFSNDFFDGIFGAGNFRAARVFNDVLTVLWVVGIMNSINMLDNMDAITASVSAFIIVEALLTIYIGHDFYNVHVIMLLGVLGALGGFLFFNWHPSRLFMGDTGSQFLGIILAIIGIRYFWNGADFGGHIYHSKQLIVTLLAFIIPICDTTAVVINRLARKQRPWIGGKDHTTHHLSYAGLSDSQVAIAFAGISLISLMLIFLIQGTIVNWEIKHILLFGGYFLVVFGTLYTFTKKTKQPPQKNADTDPA